MHIQLLRLLRNHVRQFARQARPIAPPRNQNPRNQQARIAVTLDAVHRRKKLLQPLKRKHLKPDRHNDVRRRSQRVERQYTQRRRAVDDDVVIVRRHSAANVPQHVFAPNLRKLHVRRRQIQRRRDQIHALRGRLDDLRRRRVSPQRLIQPRQRVVRLHRKTQVALRITVQRQHTLAAQRQPRRQRLRGGRLRHAAFLVDKRGDSRHSPFILSCSLHMLDMVHVLRIFHMLHMPVHMPIISDALRPVKACFSAFDTYTFH